MKKHLKLCLIAAVIKELTFLIQLMFTTTDRVEFYFVHSFDCLTSIEETLRAMDDLQHQGKILYPAVSNWAAWQITKALGLSDKEGLSRFELIQPMYNLVKRQSEVEILRMAEYAKGQGHYPATLAVAWVMSHPAITAPIIGARNLEQLEPSLAALISS